MRIGAMPGVAKSLDAAARSSTYRSGMRLEAVMVSDLEGVLVYRHIGGLVNDGTGCALLVASGVVLRGGEQAVVDLAQGDGQRLCWPLMSSSQQRSSQSLKKNSGLRLQSLAGLTLAKARW